MTIVRYATDFVMGFQSVVDERPIMLDLRKRLAWFRLQLHEDKTKLIEFGR